MSSEHLNLESNQIEEYGIKQLSQCNWNNLTSLELSNPRIKRLQYSRRNRLQVAESIFVEASQFLIFKQLILNLDENNILKTGCRWLSKANWNQLKLI
jgi:hypothetical protein